MLPLIGAFKLAKGLLILIVALGALRLVHADVADAVERWTSHLHVDPDGRHLGRAVHALTALDERQLRALSVGAFVYAGLFLVEGVGLLLRLRWAEYFTVIVTSSFVPFELYEIVRRPTTIRVAALLVNLAIVWYLVVQLRRPSRARRRR